MKLRTATVKRFYCPSCGAPPDAPCRAPDGSDRATLHKSRVMKAERLISATLRAEKRFLGHRPPVAR